MFWNSKETSESACTEPRDHHYVFSYYTVREACAYDPVQFFALFASPERESFIAWLWQSTEEDVGEPLTDVDPTELAVTTCRVKESPTIILKMPTPTAVTEAHLIGVVLSDLQNAESAAGKPAFRYFTLEYGVGFDNSTRTVLCEWFDNGGRANFGDGPAPTVEAFLVELEGRI